MSNTFIEQIAELRERPKRAQCGGVRKGRSWARAARDRMLRATAWGPGSIMRHMRLREALTIIKNHSRREATRAEAVRLLKLLEG
jgi:hypothetical protein